MTLADLKAMHRDKVRNWSIKNLKADADFMADCRENEDLRDWVLSQRPEIKSEKSHKIKFLGLKPVTEAEHVKSPPVALVEPEAVEKIPRTVQLYRDVVKHSKRNGFLI